MGELESNGLDVNPELFLCRLAVGLQAKFLNLSSVLLSVKSLHNICLIPLVAVD